jgi:twitching motility protein PilT
MAQLDRLLAVMVSNRAQALLLDEGDLAKLDLPGGARPVTKSPLSAPQVVGLLKEIAPPDAARQLDAAKPASFAYTSSDGTFAIKAMIDGGKWRVRIAREVRAEPTPSSSFDPLSGFVVAPENGASAAAPSAAPRDTPSHRTPFAPVSAIAGVGAPTPALNQAAVAAPAASPAAAPTVARATVEAVVQFAGIEAARGAVEELLRLTVERGASDLHLRCGEPPIIRLHGEMHRLEGRAPVFNDELSAMLRSIMPERNLKEFEESNDTDYAHEIPGCARFRANALKDRMGVAGVFRQIPSQVVTVEQMNVSPEVQALCYLTKGLVLVTGPTGSGKSTTLCALVDLVNRARNDHVITIEDPIEFVHANKNCIITQRQVGVHTKSFKAALRAALREDPDIVLVGELRDLETVSIAIETAETGHLVFGTLHTTTAAGTIDRIIDQFPADRQEQIRMMLSDSLKGVISQTLCKKVGGGRVAAREILLSIPAVSNLIREAKTFQIPSIMQTSRRLGMILLNDALIEYVDKGIVEPKEAYMKSVDKMNFMATLKQKGHDTSFAESDLASQTQGKTPDAMAAKAPAKPAPAGKR